MPEITFLFWVIKILTTAGGEATSDYLALDLGSRLEAGVIEAGLFLIALVIQFRTRRYSAFAYWFLAYAIAIFGTGVADAMHLFIGIPYSGTTALWAVVLAAVFWLWYRSERTLSIHSIFTQRREIFYWCVVFATFAEGTALGDYTATALHLGYLASGIMFFFIILIPAVAWSGFKLNSVVAFWFAYVVTRPLGASFADYFSKPHSLSGANYGDATVALITTIIVAILVGYLAVTRHDIQQPVREQAERPAAVNDDVVGR
ncbi:MAG: COG4705 family protein [Streptosporangiaceae bacterium]